MRCLPKAEHLAKIHVKNTCTRSRPVHITFQNPCRIKNLIFCYLIGIYQYNNLYLNGQVSLFGSVNGKILEDDFIRSSPELQIISSNIVFHDDFHVLEDVNISSGVLVNGLDLVHLDKSVVKTVGRQEIHGVKTFLVTTMCASMQTTTINGINTDNDLLHTFKTQRIQGTYYKSILIPDLLIFPGFYFAQLTMQTAEVVKRQSFV